MQDVELVTDASPRDDAPAASPTPDAEAHVVDTIGRRRHEALAAIEREAAELLGARLRSLPRLIADLRAML